jgi:diaminopimelate epimerase
VNLAKGSLGLVKAHAYGNDFLLVAAADVDTLPDLARLARQVCDRHRGIGADGLMIVAENAAGAATRLLNADGSPSELSGNGVRCVGAWLARERQLQPGATLTIGTGAGPKALELASIDPEGCRFTFRAAMGRAEAVREERLEVEGETITAVVLRVGNPQCVVFGEVSEARLQTLAARLAVHAFFPGGTNVELAMVEDPSRVRILIWERGVGPTEASGTGACAAAVAAAAFAGASRIVDVVAPGGTQRVELTDDGIYLTGWAEIIGRADMHVVDRRGRPQDR